ncbi:MAG: cysteine--tRNA ligase [bacterium]|nr:cysteine--tRNA ligase [bacterium]
MADITLFNSYTRKKENVHSLKKGKLSLFVCGPTVYNYVHLGNARTYASFDMIVKYLRFSGLDVFYLQNITDIDDKIIAQANETGVSAQDLALEFEQKYYQDMQELGVDSVNEYARATDFIPEIIAQVNILLEKGYAYDISGDGIYYDISRFEDYGKLAGRTAEQADDGVSRIDEAVEKRNRGDFALWKRSKEGEPSWESPWGEGRPGWHIEDTAITEKYFGPQYDIHGGARDLIFPHHEAEIAQMEAISGKKPLVRTWMHTGFLTVQGEKMSKSKGNFITAREFLKDHSPRLFRLLMLKHHYRLPFDYTESALEQTEAELRYLDAFTDRLRVRAESANPLPGNSSNRIMEDWKSAMNDDFNTPKALASLFELANEGNRLLDENKLSPEHAMGMLSILKAIDSVFSFLFQWRENLVVPHEIQEVVARREQARQEKNWAEADKARQELETLGWETQDTPNGPQVRKK